MNDSGTDLADIGPEPAPAPTLYRRLRTVSRPVSGLTDDERARRNDVIATTVTGLARRRADSLVEAGHKRTVVGNRLRTETRTPRSPFGGLTLRVLDSARDDLARLTLPIISPGMDPGMEGRPE